MSVSVRTMTDRDQDAVLRIYQEGIDSGHATFTAETPPWDEWDNMYRKDCRIVATDGGAVVGWAALKPISTRSVYSGVTDISIYVDKRYWDKGVGNLMMREIIDTSEANNIWTIRAHMFRENKISEHLHAKHGFRVLGIGEKQGRMENGPYAGQWRDVLLMERRSKTVGTS